MKLDFSTLSLKDRYKIMSRTVIPRPIAWIVTEGEYLNIAPFSYFIPLSSEPPALLVSIGHKKDGSPKDTLKNIEERKKCTICMVDEAHLKQMHFTSKALQESEAEYFDIPTKRIFEEFPPIVEGVPAAFFCSFLQRVELGGKTVPLVLKVERYYVDDRYVKEDYDIELDLIARVGAKYAKLGESIEPPQIP